MIYCPGCGIANRDGSRFCNECGTKLPTMTSSLCPTCSTPNPPHSLFCEKCGTRLIASLAEEPEDVETSAPAAFLPKGLSLPTKPPTEVESAATTLGEPEPARPAEEELPDWMQVVQTAVSGTAELNIATIVADSGAATEAPPEEIPAWLSDLDLGGQTAPPEKPSTDELLPEWAQRLRTMPEAAQPAAAEEEEVPDWLKTLGATGQLPSVQEPPAAAPEVDLTPAAFAASSEPPADATEELPEWLKEPATPYFSSEPQAPLPASPAQPAADDMPDWLRDLRPTASTEDALPDWLDELGVEEEPAVSKSMALSTGDSALDWLSQLSATAPDAEPLEPEAAPAPDWMSSLRASTPALDTQPTEEALDWLRTGETSLPSLETPAPGEPPDWMSSLREAEPNLDTRPADGVPGWLHPAGTPSPALETPMADEPPDWMSSLRAAPLEPEPPAEEAADLPDWLKGAGLVAGAAARGAVAEEEQPEEIVPQRPVTDWLSALREATPELETGQAQIEDETPAWLRQETGAAPQAIGGVQNYDQEVPDWLRETSAASEQPAASAEAAIPDWLRETETPLDSAEVPPTQSEDEGVPAWLQDAGLAAPGAAAFGALAEEETPEATAPQQPASDWLSALRQATPEPETGQAQIEDETPAWLQEETKAAPQAIGGVPSYDQEVPDWLREIGAASEQPAASAEAAIPAWLRETETPLDSAEVPPTQSEDEGVPAWLQGAGLAAPGAAAFSALAEEEQPEAAAPQQSASDWLSALRQATPEPEAGQAQIEDETPAWLQEETKAAPQAIGSVPSYDQEVPDWLRETGATAAPSTPAEETDVPDWLREESGAVLTSAPPAAAESEEDQGVPDWLKGLGTATVGAAVAASRAEEPSEEGVPDWLREEPAPAAQPAVGEVPDWLREAEPAPAITFETPQEEEAVPGETPDWLRELAPAAAVAALAPEVEEPEESEQPEEAVELEPEEEGWASKAAPVAAVAGAAKKAEPTEAAPAEMPEWLKEIRQEQQFTRTTIPVPATEAAGLIQAEIPAWIEALRPTEEAGASHEAETPSETEGPLAGIINALPPAPLMGEMTGLPAKLQFAISAEDQARAGVLKELLTQHAVAPASVEQFGVKGSAIRRRALRWVVAFLIITALFVPFAVNINLSTDLQLMPTANNMIVPPANQAAAVAIAELVQLPTRAKVLVVFDYDASQSGEMNRVAAALLKSPALANVDLEIASLNPQGSAVAQTVMKDFPDLRYTDRGFKPGQVNGVQSLLSEAGDVSLIIELAASPETVRWWAEQLKANRDETPLVVGISAGAEPLTMPYVQSGQVQGLVSGFPGAVAYLNVAQQMNTYSQEQIDEYQIPLDALTLVNYIMVALIVVGLIAALLRGAGRRSA